MYTVDSWVNDSVQATKTFASFVPNDAVKREIEVFAEAQGAYAKALFAFSQKMNEAAFNEIKQSKLFTLNK